MENVGYPWHKRACKFCGMAQTRSIDLRAIRSPISQDVETVTKQGLQFHPEAKCADADGIPALKNTSTLVQETGRSRRMIIKARKGKVRPHRENQLLLISILRKLELI